MSLINNTIHSVRYGTWLVGQIIKESVIMAIDTLGTGRNIAPIILYYPLRVTCERDIAGFIASITMTPGTLALGVTGPKEVDYDAIAGNRGLDASAVAESEFKTHGLDTVQRFLAVHAMYGSDPQELLDSLADMEERLAPHVKSVPMKFDVEYLVERGRKGPRGYRGSRGGRASDETVFDVEKVDSTPHAAAFVAAILEANDDEKDPDELRNMDRMERYEVARRNAERARAAKKKDSTGAPDIDTFAGDNLGASLSDRQGRTKPGETLYDPLYPENNPRDDKDVSGKERWKQAPRHWKEKHDEEAEKASRVKKRSKKKRKGN
ncbi:MnhE protein [Corynebacterium sp. 320]|uniref:Na+/H+ antiporter subunit E n=1 Tax=Corynebacterium TaxID=1716 RepID=UPI00125CB699|nr:MULTISPECIES: Na+/H+ antiporter subunit E [Corynebacterium]KAB1502866.1 MnhE protein [Corynebacterium sp. 320]KAB1552377.1 MnhE protein [Corynebacterium sp. 321]KAB1554408.1 MnhE protein [Corynebacterium sp. 319]KAB3526529.1 MnhE protein [Corynebacterium sp. 250]KAB3539849.1 MnhE protein [Corynebacterium sp. 366]